MRTLAVTLTALLLAGCAASDTVSTLQPPGYLAKAPALVAAADWSAPDTVSLRLGANGFAPSELLFHRDRPTRLVIHNATTSDHDLEAEQFFRDIAVWRLTGPDGERTAPWVESIGLPAGQTREVWFIPARYGAYRFECSRLGHASLGERGLISVEP
jgi:uncharacterized cupredoxin-like copper-binding protein